MSFHDFLLIAPPHTPFTTDGRLRLDAVDQQARLLADTSVDGVFVAGTTGECASLTLAERLTLAEKWNDAARPHDLEVIVQVGSSCQADAMVIAEHAQRIGADAVAAHAPSYFRPVNIDALIEFLAPVAAAADDLPFYFYDIPSTTGVRLPMVEFLAKAKVRMPNLVGLKYSNDDLVQLQECVRFHDGEYRVLFGCDEMLLAGVSLGVQGAIGSTYNFAAPLYRRMLKALAAGNWDEARACQARSVALVRCFSRYGFMAACKAAMPWFGVECGPVRPPFRELTDEQRQSLRGELGLLGWFDAEPTDAPVDPWTHIST